MKLPLLSCLVILSMILSQAASAQEEYIESQVIDSLKTHLNDEDSIKREAVRMLIKQYGNRTKYDSVRHYLSILKRLPKRNEDEIID